MYHVLKPSRSRFVRVRSIDYHLREWGQPAPGQPPLVLLHGWMDVAASYQFMVDAMADDRHTIAPDWRGFGLTGSGGADSFWFPDYAADLDFLLQQLSPDAPVDVVGHSMGGNVAMLYAGVRPARIRRLVNLEGFGMPATHADQAPKRYSQWIDDLHSLHGGTLALKAYPDLAAVAQRLMKTNRRLLPAQAHWLAQHWAQEQTQPDGSQAWHILADNAHKLRSAQLFRVDETLALYRQISAPLLAVEASDDSLGRWSMGSYRLDEYHQRLQSVPDVRIAVVNDAGHMLHHDQPQQLARLVEDFLA